VAFISLLFGFGFNFDHWQNATFHRFLPIDVGNHSGSLAFFLLQMHSYLCNAQRIGNYQHLHFPQFIILKIESVATTWAACIGIFQILQILFA